MARRSRRQGGGRRSKRDDIDVDEDRPSRRGGVGGRARPRPSGGGSTGVIVGGVVALLIVVIVVFARSRPSGSRPAQRSRRSGGSGGAGDRIENIAPAVTASAPVAKSISTQVFEILQEAKQLSRQGDTAAALAKCQEVLGKDPAYAGDAYGIMSSALGEPTPANKERKKEYYRQAIAAYNQPGAKSALYPGRIPQRIVKLQQLLQMIDIEAGHAR